LPRSLSFATTLPAPELTSWFKAQPSNAKRGAGEIVLNCMASDGVRNGYDLEQLKVVRGICKVPLIASGGAGTPQHFSEVFKLADVDGALAASVFHSGSIVIPELKSYLRNERIEIRP